MASPSDPLGYLQTSVPPIVFTPEGIIVPPDIDILAGAQEDINNAFGGGVNPALTTPQGQIASSETAVVSDNYAAFLYFLTQIDPQFSTGRFQDAIARIYYLNRKGASSTVVSCNLVGVAGTLIPTGTLAQDTSGNTYALLGDVTIPGSGTAVNTQWANLVTGPIPCPENTLQKVYQAIPGWDAINNPDEGVIGSLVETPSEFEFRRKNSVAINSHGTPPAIYANVFNVEGVLDCYVIDNPEDEVVLYGSTSYPLAKHSIYVAVVGGTDTDVAQAIWNKKDGGCNYNGNTTVVVQDPSGYSYPPPNYPVKFERPDPVPVLFAIQIANVSGLPSNIEASIKAAVIARFNGTDGTSRERIGSPVLASRYYGAIAAVNQAIVLLSVNVGTVAPDAPSALIGIDQVPTLNASDISVTRV